MEVILLERVEKLGQMGDVVNVKPGFARNFLLPRKKALRATKDNRDMFEGQRKQLEADNLKRKEEAEKVAASLDGMNVVMIRSAGDSGQLYGSVTARDVATGVTEGGVTIDRGQVAIDHPIKELGLHDLRVVLHPEVSATVTVNVARSTEEAERQAETGRAVNAAEEEAAEIAAEAETAAAAAATAAEEFFEQAPEENLAESLAEAEEEVAAEEAAPVETEAAPESDESEAGEAEGETPAEGKEES